MLRSFQKELAKEALSRCDNVLIQADTGSGKTRVLAEIAKHSDRVLIVAHRNALVSQLSLEFARAGIAHSMFAAKPTKRRAEYLQRTRLGKVLLDGAAKKHVCSIDTLLSKAKRHALGIDASEEWLIIVDEAHHMIDENKWGKLCELFKNCRVVGATATPCRLDGVSLKRGDGGVFDDLIQAEELKTDSITTLIKKGFISPFKCYGVEPCFDVSRLALGKNDYTTASQQSAVGGFVQKMAGDAVSHYKRLANGKQAVAFCISIEFAKETAKTFRANGVAAAAIHSKMGASEVNRIFDLFESRQIQVLCNVDMTGEGVDIPAIEVLIMLRKTASFGLYRQWVGRSLRPCSGKEFAVIIDHADNIRSHGLPDRHIDWHISGALNLVQKSNLVECKKCGFLIKAWCACCPECGAAVKSDGFSTRDLIYVDVSLVELHRTRKAQDERDGVSAALVPASEIKYLNKKGGKVDEMATRVARWFFDNIKDKVTRVQAEQFFFKNNNMQFWASRFTLAEISKPSAKKCLKVFDEFTNYKR